ncbi:ATP-binding cassette subfamily B protein [Mycoplasma testudineum]|uniref:ATP-binding cassette subfamily B protein n=1 Tax=Mycoplasma testudineum TaxID=244584 RepID=A0A4R6IHT3_9MOLU|nr:ABC transporter ATP-binding protein [Mycoplasma testudineum]OYD27081.1 hypothetical protein CG473_00300 [Mycoplasma testudineum]TDO21165.1 ATP-binding cassette subfamily B protein [Mycoplasma testudineum]
MFYLLKIVRGRLLVIVILTIILILVQTGVSYYQTIVLSELIPSPNSGSLSNDNFVINLILVFALALAAFISSLFANYFAVSASSQLAMQLRLQIYDKILKLTNKDIQNFTTASLTVRSTSDIKFFQEAFLEMIIFIPRGASLVIGAIVTGIILSPSLSLIMAFTIPFFIIITSTIGAKSRKFLKLQREALDTVQRLMRESILGTRVIKSYNLENKLQSGFDEADNLYVTTSKQSAQRFSFIQPIAITVINVSIMVAFIVASYLQINGIDTQILSLVIPFTLVIFRSSIGLFLLSYGLTQIMMSSQNANRVSQVLKFEIIKKWNDENLEITNGDIELKDVNFRYYESSKLALENINIKIKNKQRIGIIGPTGSGKSTLVNLLVRNFEPESGTIKISNTDISLIDKRSLNNDVGLAFQEPQILSGTIKSNIELVHRIENIKDLESKNNEIINSLRLAEAWEFVNKFENNIDHVIEQRGNNLSGGQKQRLQIARIMAQKAKITIFDDSTSALDKITERNVLSNINNELDTTLIVVAQRIDSVENMDKIIFMDNGKIISQGTHAELLRENKHYRNIAYIQNGKERTDAQIRELNNA